MSARITFATALRVARQLRRDPRTIALIVVVPAVLIWLLSELFGADSPTFRMIAVPMLGLFPFIIMFLVTSITMLRERTSGTLERLMTTPLHKLDLLGGYGIAFAGVAAVQALVVSAVAYLLIGLDTENRRRRTPSGEIRPTGTGRRGSDRPENGRPDRRGNPTTRGDDARAITDRAVDRSRAARGGPVRRIPS